MSRQKQCIDFYGERLKVGDVVIPIQEEALIIGIGGVISKIEYSEIDDNHYITITDKNGNILLEGVDAICYTTQARYNERENQKYVYSLTFYNKRLWPMTTVPLTNKTDSEYEIPDGTCFVVLGAEHLQKKDSYIFHKIYYFIVDGEAKVCHRKEDDMYYLLNPETYDCLPISNNNKIFKNAEELKNYVKGIIEYFNSANLTYVNNNEEFDKNENGKEFEKNLIYYLKH